MKRLTTIAAAVLLAAPMPALSHGAPNWKAVAWERNQNTPEGVRFGFFVDVNSITRAGDIVSFKEEWHFMDEQNRPVEMGIRGGVIPSNELIGYMRIQNCKTQEHLTGRVFRGADGKAKVKQLATWSPVPAGPNRTVTNLVCRQR